MGLSSEWLVVVRQFFLYWLWVVFSSFSVALGNVVLGRDDPDVPRAVSQLWFDPVNMEVISMAPSLLNISRSINKSAKLPIGEGEGNASGPGLAADVFEDATVWMA